MKNGIVAILLLVCSAGVAAQENQATPEDASVNQAPPVRIEYLQCLSKMQVSAEKAMSADISRKYQLAFLRARLPAVECSASLLKRTTDPEMLDRFMGVNAVYDNAIAAPSAFSVAEYMRTSMEFMHELP